MKVEHDKFKSNKQKHPSTQKLDYQTKRSLMQNAVETKYLPICLKSTL